MSTTPKDIFEKDFDYYPSDVRGEYQSTKVNGLQFIFGKLVECDCREENDCRGEYKRGIRFDEKDEKYVIHEMNQFNLCAMALIRNDYPEANFVVTEEVLRTLAYASFCLSYLNTKEIFDALADPHTALNFFKERLCIEKEHQNSLSIGETK